MKHNAIPPSSKPNSAKPVRPRTTSGRLRHTTVPISALPVELPEELGKHVHGAAFTHMISDLNETAIDFHSQINHCSLAYQQMRQATRDQPFPNPLRTSFCCALLDRLFGSKISNDASGFMDQLKADLFSSLYCATTPEVFLPSAATALDPSLHRFKAYTLYFKELETTTTERDALLHEIKIKRSSNTKELLLMERIIQRWQTMLVDRLFSAWRNFTARRAVWRHSNDTAFFNRKKRTVLRRAFVAWSGAAKAEIASRQLDSVSEKYREQVASEEGLLREYAKLVSGIEALKAEKATVQETLRRYNEDLSSLKSTVEHLQTRLEQQRATTTAWRELAVGLCRMIVNNQDSDSVAQQQQQLVNSEVATSFRTLNNNNNNTHQDSYLSGSYARTSVSVSTVSRGPLPIPRAMQQPVMEVNASSSSFLDAISQQRKLGSTDAMMLQTNAREHAPRVVDPVLEWLNNVLDTFHMEQDAASTNNRDGTLLDEEDSEFDSVIESSSSASDFTQQQQLQRGGGGVVHVPSNVSSTVTRHHSTSAVNSKPVHVPSTMRPLSYNPISAPPITNFTADFADGQVLVDLIDALKLAPSSVELLAVRKSLGPRSGSSRHASFQHHASIVTTTTTTAILGNSEHTAISAIRFALKAICDAFSDVIPPHAVSLVEPIDVAWATKPAALRFLLLCVMRAMPSFSCPLCSETPGESEAEVSRRISSMASNGMKGDDAVITIAEVRSRVQKAVMYHHSMRAKMDRWTEECWEQVCTERALDGATSSSLIALHDLVINHIVQDVLPRSVVTVAANNSVLIEQCKDTLRLSLKRNRDAVLATFHRVRALVSSSFVTVSRCVAAAQNVMFKTGVIKHSSARKISSESLEAVARLQLRVDDSGGTTAAATTLLDSDSDELSERAWVSIIALICFHNGWVASGSNLERCQKSIDTELGLILDAVLQSTEVTSRFEFETVFTTDNVQGVIQAATAQLGKMWSSTASGAGSPNIAPSGSGFSVRFDRFHALLKENTKMLDNKVFSVEALKKIFHFVTIGVGDEMRYEEFIRALLGMCLFSDSAPWVAPATKLKAFLAKDLTVGAAKRAKK